VRVRYPKRTQHRYPKRDGTSPDATRYYEYAEGRRGIKAPKEGAGAQQRITEAIVSAPAHRHIRGLCLQ
jgi:hypothetical protein